MPGSTLSLESACVCVVDGTGRIVREGKLASEPDVLIAWFGSQGFAMTRIRLFAAMKAAGFAVELLETRHVHTALKTMPVKTDRNDARGIAS